MQKLNVTELSGFRNEYEMTCAAQDGDGLAWMALWKHYRKMMMSRLVAVKGFTRRELESEAIDVFTHKLERFNRSKVSSEAAFSMFSWLFCAVVNRTNKLIRQRKRDVHLYFENVNANDDRDGTLDTIYSRDHIYYYDGHAEDTNPLQNQMLGFNDELYTTYDPEKIVVEKLQKNDSDRVKTFYAKLTQFDKDILEARREGLTLAEVAKRFCCSITTVKNHIYKAKRYANDIFQVCYA
jgi:RNA polymerase sigma factor (sigma-70 family)